MYVQVREELAANGIKIYQSPYSDDGVTTSNARINVRLNSNFDKPYTAVYSVHCILYVCIYIL